MVVVKIPEHDDERDDDTPPWRREVPEGWHRARIQVRLDPYRKGQQDLLQVAYMLASGAQLQDDLDLQAEDDRARLGRIARAAGTHPAPCHLAGGFELDTADLDGRLIEVLCRHGQPKRDPPPVHWQNVKGYRPAHQAAESPAQDEELPL